MLEGRTAMVSGGASGFGRAAVAALLDAGAQVVTFDVDSRVVERCPPDDRCLPLQADATVDAHLERVVAAAAERFGGIDILINNAAIWRATPVTSSWAQAVADYDAIIGTNLRALVMLSRLCMPYLQRRGGDVVNISAEDVLPADGRETNFADSDLYNAGLWALNGLTDAWSKALAPSGVRVNGLCLGLMATPMLEARLSAGHGVKPALTPQDGAQALLRLLASSRNGENVPVPGGDLPLPEPPTAHRRISG